LALACAPAGNVKQGAKTQRKKPSVTARRRSVKDRQGEQAPPISSLINVWFSSGPERLTLPPAKNNPREGALRQTQSYFLEASLEARPALPLGR
jgi:hypothetical protein